MTEIINSHIPITALVPHKQNYRKHPEKQVQRLAASLERFTQFRSIVVQAQPKNKYRIVAGHGLVEGAKSQGIETIRADILPQEWDDATIEGILLTDNLSSQLSEDDPELLLELLETQKNSDYALETVGTDDEFLQDLLNKERTRSLEVNEPEGGEVSAKLSVLVECNTEDEQHKVYDLVTENGYLCRILTL